MNKAQRKRAEELRQRVGLLRRQRGVQVVKPPAAVAPQAVPAVCQRLELDNESGTNLIAGYVEGKCVGDRGQRAWRETARRTGARVELYSGGSSRTLWGRRWRAFLDLATRLESESFAGLLLLADVRDVVFQRDPFTEVSAADGTELWLYSEGYTLADHTWIDSQRRLFSKLSLLPPPADSHLEINGGVVCGTPAGIRRMATEVLTWEPLFSRDLKLTDQPVINSLFLSGRLGKAVVIPQEDARAWCLHGDRVARGAGTGTFYRDETVARVGPDGKAYAMYHQWDRVPAHAQAVLGAAMPRAESARVTLVVCRYKEDVSWLCDYADRCGIYVANKLTPAGWPGRVVENRGYEPYAYFQFFIDNYDNLPDVCVCVQGNPWDHLKRSSFDQILTALEAQRMWFLPLNGDGHSAWQTPDGGPSHPGLGPALTKWWQIVTGHAPHSKWYAWYGGQFAVSREAVRSRPKAFWVQCAETCRTRDDACALERLWAYVFEGPDRG